MEIILELQNIKCHISGFVKPKKAHKTNGFCKNFDDFRKYCEVSRKNHQMGTTVFLLVAMCIYMSEVNLYQVFL